MQRGSTAKAAEAGRKEGREQGRRRGGGFVGRGVTSWLLHERELRGVQDSHPDPVITYTTTTTTHDEKKRQVAVVVGERKKTKKQRRRERGEWPPGSEEADRRERKEEQQLIQQLQGSYSKLKSGLRSQNWSCRHK